MKNILIIFIAVVSFNTFIIYALAPVKEESQKYTKIEEEEKSQPLDNLYIDKIEELPKFFNFNLLNNRIKENSAYADIINHSNDPYLIDSRMTNAHESTHDINSYIRNTHVDSIHVNGFYLRENRAIVLVEPNIRKNDVINYVPVSLREYRFKHYLVAQKAWDNRSLYILDEAVAYLNGGFVAVQDYQQGRYKDINTDAVSGSIEFSIYSIALAMAVESKDKTYWDSNPEFRIFIKWYLKEAEKVFNEGIKIDKFTGPFLGQFKLMKNIKESPDAAEMRSFIYKYFDGVWLK